MVRTITHTIITAMMNDKPSGAIIVEYKKKVDLGTIGLTGDKNGTKLEFSHLLPNFSKSVK